MGRGRRWLGVGTTMIVLLALAAWAAAPVARGDVVHMKDGSTIEGKIVAETADGVEVKQRLGTIKIPREEILKVERTVSKTELPCPSPRITGLARAS